MSTGTLRSLQTIAGQGGDPFGPIDWGTLTHGLPITSFFRTHYPGVKSHRDELVIDVDRSALIAKLQYWNLLPPAQRAQGFRNSATRTCPDNHIVDPTKVIGHRYRPLDMRFLYKVDKFIDPPGTISRIYEQVPGIVSLLTMDTRTTAGPVVIASDSLPGYNSFRGSYETHCFPLVGPSGGGQLPGFTAAATLPDALTPAARLWANSLGASTDDVACYMLALGNAPSYQQTFAEALEADIVRFPAITDQQLFRQAVNVGRRLLQAWKLQAPARGSWTQAATGTQLGEAQILGDHIVFANGDRLDNIHPQTAEFKTSGYPVMERFLQARSHLELTIDVGLATRMVVGAIAAILDERHNSDTLLASAIQAPSTTW